MPQFWKDGTGSVATMSALLAVPIMLAAGMAVDHARVVNARGDVQSATDAAALGLLTMETADTAALTARAGEIVALNLGDAHRLANIDVTARRVGDDIEVEADVALKANFMQIGGFPTLETVARSVATQGGGGGYVDVYLLIDRSFSMLLAQPGEDMDRMMALTRPMIEGTDKEYTDPDGCAFACHGVHPWQADGVPLYQHAVDNGIALRIDTVLDSAETLAETLLGNGGSGARIGIVNFASTTELALEPTRDLDAVREALATDPGLSGLTQYNELFDFLENTVGEPGAGHDAEAPRVLFVLITDGVYTQWYEDGRYKPRAVATSNDGKMHYEMFDPALCRPLVERGYEISVLNTLYAPLPNSWGYDYYVKPYADDIDDALTECVTETYAEGLSTEEIEAAFAEMAAYLDRSPPRIKY